MTHNGEIKEEFCILPKTLYVITAYGFLIDSSRKSGFFEKRKYILADNGKKYYLFEQYRGL